ncbi:MAG: DNA-binding winged helix-turn-helix (wHTH) protein/tetratricopeptide (TPR) repeat protein [Colwellia sp.]|jgi:DNA-binding winged helix-turn-helix (wHTH) protein/tetratricopeptide (TPR) repeat protein
MLPFIKTANHEIHLISYKVMYQGESLKIRTKTFLLLRLLVESPGQIISKKQILNEVWDDIYTDDQVIFQSIKELRKIFNGFDIIKTHPRKGYAWIEPVSHEEQQEVLDNSHIHINNAFNKKTLSIGLFLLLFVVFIFFIIETQNKESKGSVIILPVINELENIDHQWVKLGLMDQIIHRLPSSLQYGVLQTDDVLDVINRANISKLDFKRKDIDNIFSVSGAKLVVESRLSGNSNDYQFIYSIHERDSIKRGVLLGDNITVIANQLAVIIGNKIDINLSEEVEYHSSFANEMLASALEKFNSEDFDSAKVLLNAAKEIEPSNLVVSRYLASVLIQKQQYDEVEKLLHESIEEAKTQDKVRELARLRTLLGQSYLITGRYSDAIETLTIAESNAKDVNDWLYLGYILSTRGKAYQESKNYLLAKESFESSINYHKVIQCPFGHAQGLFALAELAMIQGNYDYAQHKINLSMSIIKERELHGLQEAVSSLSRIIENRK